MTTPDAIIIGGGAVGCAVAASLAEQGARVTLLERDRLGAHASSAAAGMLVPFAEAGERGPFAALCRAGFDRLAEVVPRLQAETGIDAEYTRCGLLRVALDGREAEELRERAARLKARGAGWLDADGARHLEPGLAPAVAGALYSPEEGYVAGERLVALFAAAAAARGARILEGAEVVGLLREGERVAGVRTRAETLPAGAVVVAAGAWASRVGEWCGVPLPVGPVRGQILALAPLSGSPRRIIWGQDAYLVPRRDGSLTVGATEEDAGFDARVTAAGVASLLQAAPRLLPGLADATFLRAWAGLRPAAPDRLPILGPVAAVPGLFVATGHYRNGILLSALTGELLAAWVLGGTCLGPNPFAPERFGTDAAGEPETVARPPLG